MNKFLKYTLIAFSANALLTILFSIPYLQSKELGTAIGGTIFLFIASIISLLIQALVGLSFLSNEQKKSIGQAMLLTVGMILLIGCSLCSIR